VGTPPNAFAPGRFAHPALAILLTTRRTKGLPGLRPLGGLRFADPPHMLGDPARQPRDASPRLPVGDPAERRGKPDAFLRLHEIDDV